MKQTLETENMLPTPQRVEVSYGAMTKDANPMFQRRVESILNRKMGGRWRLNFDTVHDKAVFEQRPQMPEVIRHPGAELYKGEQPKTPTLYYGKDEDGHLVGWELNSRTVHSLVIGPTGGGKTTVLRSLIVGAVCQGIPVYGVDPKRVELRPFEGFPGVGGIASSPEKMADLIERMHAFMMKRYSLAERNEVGKDDLPLVTFILDEFAILTRVLTTLWKNTPEIVDDGKGGTKEKKRTGTPVWIEMIMDMLALSRTARIHLVIGTQRPDAKMFEGGGRDNLRHRISLSRLSGQGAKMLWDNSYVGTDTPLVSGRAVASPDGSRPIEVQTFWVDDPWGAESGTKDREILDSIADLAQERFQGFDWPIAREDFELFAHDADRDPARGPAPVDTSADEDEEDSEGPVFATTGNVTEHSGDGLADFETEGVMAESLCEGDQVLLDSGNLATVREVEDVEDDGDDRVLLTLDEYGDMQSLELDSSDLMERKIEDDSEEES